MATPFVAFPHVICSACGCVALTKTTHPSKTNDLEVRAKCVNPKCIENERSYLIELKEIKGGRSSVNF